jgi:hypothetical protein
MANIKMTDDFGREVSEARLLPLGGGANAIVGGASYLLEMKYRKREIAAGRPFDIPKWKSLKIYFKDGVIQ